MDLISIFAAGSGHPCGTLSVMDIAAALYLNALNHVYVIMGDGEQQDGSIWEAAMAAGHHKLDNICAVVDVNRLQIDGRVKDVMNVEPLAEKYLAFGWNVIAIDGHDLSQILDAFARARETGGRPTVILAQTVKGKGVSFMENVASWHGTAPKKEQLEAALQELLPQDFPRAWVDSLLKRAATNASEVARVTKESIPKFAREPVLR